MTSTAHLQNKYLKTGLEEIPQNGILLLRQYFSQNRKTKLI